MSAHITAATRPGTSWTKRAAIFASTVALGLSAVACSSDEADGDQLLIGATNSVTGPFAASCGPISDGASLWFDHIEEEGGVDGQRFRYDVLDDAGDASRAVGNVRRHIGNEAFAVVGGCGTIQAGAIHSILNDAEVPYLLPYAGLGPLQDSDEQYVIPFLPQFHEQMGAMVRWGFDSRGSGSVFTALTQIPGADVTLATVEEEATRGGGSSVGSSFEAPGVADLTPLALEIKAANPDYLVMVMLATDAARLVDVLIAQDAMPNIAILGASTQASNEFASSLQAGEAAERIFAASPIRLPASASESQCVSVIEAAGLDFAPTLLFGCLQGAIFTHAFAQAGSDPTPEDVLAVLPTLSAADIDGALPEIDLGPGSPGLKNIFVVGFADGGTFVTEAEIPLG